MKKSAKVKKPVQSGLADERFTHLKSDPKFSTLSNKNKKVRPAIYHFLFTKTIKQ